MGRGGSDVQCFFLQDLADFKAFRPIIVNQGAQFSRLLYENLHKIHTEKFNMGFSSFSLVGFPYQVFKKKKRQGYEGYIWK